MKKKNKKGKYGHWPKEEKLKEALNAFEDFRDMCQHQMDLGYWATIDFPSKHHINKILSLQYIDKELLEMVYGKGMVARTFKLMPYCKSYIAFVRDIKEDKNVNKQQNNDNTIKASA